jgi:hypothetical protein
MKKYAVVSALSLTLVFSIMPTKKSHAIVWVIIQEAIKAAILAIDAQVQRLQNKTIGLQNAQKAIENALSKLKLKEISEWGQKQKDLYDKYYKELWKVKNAIGTYKKVREIIKNQAALVGAYKNAFGLFKKDGHFTTAELNYMARVYTGILDESLKNIDQLLLAINAFETQMSDSERLTIIEQVAQEIDENASDLRRFNQQNILLSIQRSRDYHEISTVKALYGIE